MDGTCYFTQTDQRHDEEQILSTIVDAMLDAKEELADATVERWREILVDSCRQKKSDADGHACLVAAC